VNKTLLSRHRLELAAATLAAALLAPRPAIAQTERDLTRARQLFKEGEIAEKASDCQGAIGKYEQALAIKETPQIHLRIGRCQEMLGRLSDGLASYERALAKATGASLVDVASVAREQIGRLAARVPTLAIIPAEPYEAFAATLDGEPVSPTSFDKKQRLNPGTHKITASARDHRAFEQTVSLTEGEGQRLVIRLVPADPTSNAGGADVVPTPDEGSNAPAFVLLGGGAAAIGVGVALFVVALGKYGDLDDACGGSERLLCPESRRDELESLASSADTLRLVGGIVGGAGVIAAGAGVVMLLTASSSPTDASAPETGSRSRAARASAPRSPWIQVTPSFDGRSVGLAARGAF
jgi:hypothetical protein